ncbi:MAG TPA: TonB-dependent receptor [Burkholderiaceae bacterium]|nr:TonB-dependent receptor [Burkholderiaceae bacterium]
MKTKMRPAAWASRAACVGLAALPSLTALAQDSGQRVEITGSSIKRTDAETALPVQVLTRKEIAATGAVNVEQLLQTVSAMTSSGSTVNSSASGATTGGLSGISLRGLTSLRTLVLINGRRIAPYGIGFVGDSVSVDVNSIPLSAIERVEVLKDGASAVYGSDAIAGVVNFILRKDYAGLELSADYGDTTRGGANFKRATITWGKGDITSDKFNVMVSASYQKEAALYGRDRDFASRGYNVDANNDTTSFNTFPANFLLLDGSGNGGNASAPACPGPYAFDSPFLTGSGFCAFDPSPLVTLIPESERANLYATARFAVSSSLELFAEASYNRNTQRTIIQPVPISELFALPPNHPFFNVPPYNGLYPPNAPGGLAGTPTGTTPGSSTIIVYPGSPYYPTSTVQALVGAGNPLVPISILYRAGVNGNRDFTDVAEAPRFVLGARGDYSGWDYEGALLYSASKVREQVNDGYPALSQILPILNGGNVNFWGPSTPDVDAALRATNFTGDAFRIKSELGSMQGKATRELMSLGGGALALALGAEYRKEKFLFDPAPIIQTGDIAGYGGNFLLTDKSRDVEAAFGEINMPLAKGLEVNAALRFDHYQGVGSSTTPKASARWQPTSSLLFRGAIGKGFRAPSLQDLYLPVTNNVTPAGASDPLRCPTTNSRTDCSTQFTTINGGNPDLKPEKSTNATLGLVLAPTNNTSLAIDAFKINLKDTIVNGVTASTILGDLDKYGYLVTRGAADPAFPTLPGPIVSITQTNLNLGETRVAGIDLDGRWAIGANEYGKFSASLTGTYFTKYDVQNPDGSFSGGIDQVNTATGGVIPRWKHYLALDWGLGPWGATLAQNFQKSYHDLPPASATGEPLRRVGAYETYDLQVRYTGIKSLTLRGGIRNLFDRPPPYSNAGGQTGFQGGYDNTYGDPRGRFVYAGVSYEFK